MAKVADKVMPARNRWASLRMFDDDLSIRGVSCISYFGRSIFTAHVFESVSSSDRFVTADIESVSNCFGDCQAKVQRSTSGNCTKTVDDSPRLVESRLTVWTTSVDLQGILEADSTNKSDKSACELSESYYSILYL